MSLFQLELEGDKTLRSLQAAMGKIGRVVGATPHHTHIQVKCRSRAQTVCVLPLQEAALDRATRHTTSAHVRSRIEPP
jgi:hypothetical protein